MTANSSGAVIRVRIKRSGGYIRATSKDVPGLFLCSQDSETLERNIIPAIKLLFKLNRGLDVEVFPMAATPERIQEPTRILNDRSADNHFVMVPAYA